jgi:glycosyltransferase involved in cell wall biosynthesis
MPDSADPTGGAATGSRALIGIPSFRRPHGLRNLLASLSEQKDVDHVQIEIFVADNDPEQRDASRVCAELQCGYRWPISCAIVEERGISAARNAILDHARAHHFALLAMLDDDETADAEWLTQIIGAKQRFQADVVAGPMYYAFDRHAPRGIIKCGVFITPDQAEGVVPVVHATPNVLFDCAALANNGWPKFDVRFGLTGGEDREYFLRLRELGFRFAWAPSAKTFERVEASRMHAAFVVRRSFSNGNADIRIRRAHGDLAGMTLSLGKAALLLGTAPAGALLLLVPSKRLWMLGKWSRSIGKFAALLGISWHEYVPKRISGAAT